MYSASAVLVVQFLK